MVVCDAASAVLSGALSVVLAVVALMVVVGVWILVERCQAIYMAHPSYLDV